MKHVLLLFLSIFLITSCDKDDDEVQNVDEVQNAFEELVSSDLLPEGQISSSVDGRMHAAYADPSEIYTHEILGDAIEAKTLLVATDNSIYEVKLAPNYVFEDIRPRLYDVDGDGALEIITIRTDVLLGAGIVIYKLVGAQLTEYAVLPEIGMTRRWVNPVAIHDIDQDGVVELVWIETPHIGGVLKVAKIEGGTMEVLASEAGYSNHAKGQRNLCLSELTENSDEFVFYVPTQNRAKIVGFTFSDGELKQFEEINQAIDFSLPLRDQHDFERLVELEDNCIF